MKCCNCRQILHVYSQRLSRMCFFLTELFELNRFIHWKADIHSNAWSVSRIFWVFCLSFDNELKKRESTQLLDNSSLNRTSQTFFLFIIPFTRTREPNKLTCWSLSDFKNRLVWALHRHHKGDGIQSRWRHPKKFKVHLWANCLNCTTSVRIISSIISQPHLKW